MITYTCTHSLPTWIPPHTHMHIGRHSMPVGRAHSCTLMHSHNTCTHMNARLDAAGTGVTNTLPRTSEEEEEKADTSFFPF